jgi:hypothetical protein
MVGIVLIIAGLLVWLLAGMPLIGIILIVVGLILEVAPGPWYGYSHYRRAPP